MVNNPIPPDPATRPDRGIRVHTGYLIRRAFNMFLGEATEALRPLGLRTTTYATLRVICDNDAMRPSDIAAAVSMEGSNMVALVDGLVEAGLVERQRSETDRRAIVLEATEEGRALADRATIVLKAREDACLGHMSAEERQLLDDLLVKVLAGL